MKKLLSIILSLVLVFTFAVSAFAGSYTTLPSSEPGDAYLTVVAAGTTYKVDIAWNSLDFVYTFGSWDTDTHDYTGGEWSQGSGQTVSGTVVTSPITVTNHSNAAVYYTVSKADIAANLNGVTVGVTPTTKTTINAVAEGGNATTGSASVTVTGTPTSVAAKLQISTITVELSAS